MSNKSSLDSLEAMRHSCSHVLAQAVKRLYKGAKLGLGPAIENGFYYDFDFPKPPSENEFGKIEKEMSQIIKENLKITKKEISLQEAKKLFQKEPYKLEIIKDLEKEGKNKVSVYSQGEFTDLCQGPHLESTGKIGAFKLQVIAGAYWKGSEKNPMLTRIYGTCFPTQKELENHLYLLEEAKKRDHRVLGEKLELFLLPEELGGGLPIWLPKGALLRRLIEDYWKEEHQKAGYLYVYTPHIAHSKLWEISGHLKFYKENMYSEIKIEKEKYRLKPMNCPFHIFVYQQKLRSYKELPLKICELGTVYRYERSGTLHGLTRVRGFTQDDAHVFCLEEQVEEEIEKILKMALNFLKTFGFHRFEVELSTKDPQAKKKYLGQEEAWQKAERALEKALEKEKVPYLRQEGEAAFYGPKIDIKIKDALGRAWQCTTIQLDFNLPERFGLTYVDKKGQKKQPFLIHRALFGSLERFIGCLIEHYGGALPLWLAPTQVKIINVGSAHKAYAQKIGRLMARNNLRYEMDLENKTMAKKILEASQMKIPYLLVVGDKELKSQSVNVRDRLGHQKVYKLDQFIKHLTKEIQEKR